ncbi:hypothetical protein PAXINDRAFT_19408 [Paxillus involutus ATCC 200175]|uniref:Uncharacterized protein n=1 Tax=Paxillus involutus ATCC 200175 TaxID=664439 RepID=A0A0C9SWW4_PAXIN|nr:hypothetical protein PAXINDRAFT_19408 [Paxillus involutus ATCC 200175]
MQNRHFWKSRVRASVTEMVAGRLTDEGTKEEEEEKHPKSQEQQEPQKRTSLSAAEAGLSSSHAEPEALRPILDQTPKQGLLPPPRLLPQNVLPASPYPMQARTTAVMRWIAASSASTISVSDHGRIARDFVRAASPVTHDADDTTREPLRDMAVPQIVLQLRQRNDQLRRQLDGSVAAKRKAEVEREQLAKEVKELRSTRHESHKPLDRTASSAAEAGSSLSLAEPTSNVGPLASKAQTQNAVRQLYHHGSLGAETGPPSSHAEPSGYTSNARPFAFTAPQASASSFSNSTPE